MPTIKELSNAKVQIFADDHLPPHFHLFGPNSNCQISIETLEILRGEARRRDLNEAMAWAEENRDLLWSKWSELNERDA